MKDQIVEDMKNAMRSGEKERLGVVRMLRSEIKKKEIDEQCELDDAAVLSIIRKMIKQRRDAAKQYQDAEREELAAIEISEIAILEPYLPAQISAEQITAEVSAAVAEQNATSIKDMGKVIGCLQKKLQGKADMGAVSAEVKLQLASK